MKLLKCEEYSLELAKLSSAWLTERIDHAWRERIALRDRQQVIVDGLKRGAHRAAELLAERYFAGARASDVQTPKRANG